MKKRNLTPRQKSERVKRERDPIPWRYCFLTLICGLILVAGFFWAASQHFSAMEYGIKNAKLRKQKEKLESEQRRLHLTREISLTPAEIKKAAKKIGLQDITARNIEVVSRKTMAEKPKNTENPAVNKPKPETAKPEKEIKRDKKTIEKNVKETKKETQENKPKTETVNKVTERERIAKK